MTTVYVIMMMLLVGAGGILVICSTDEKCLKIGERVVSILFSFSVMAIGIFLLVGPVGAKVWSCEINNLFDKLDGENDEIMITRDYVEFAYVDDVGNVKYKKCLTPPGNHHVFKENINIDIPVFIRNGRQYTLLWPAHATACYTEYEIREL